jgi:hypothetical protein
MISGLPEPLEPPPVRPSSGRLIAAAALVLLVAGGALAAWWSSTEAPATPSATVLASTSDTAARAPADTRIIVRVVNGSGIRGQARRATLALRDFGYDVVDYDSERDGARASTQIVVHTGHRDWAARIQRALGTGTIDERADSLRYVDLTVILGRDWQPPAEPLRP